MKEQSKDRQEGVYMYCDLRNKKRIPKEDGKGSIMCFESGRCKKAYQRYIDLKGGLKSE